MCVLELAAARKPVSFRGFRNLESEFDPARFRSPVPGKEIGRGTPRAAVKPTRAPPAKKVNPTMSKNAKPGASLDIGRIADFDEFCACGIVRAHGRV
jgi:hypothetical protein